VDVALGKVDYYEAVGFEDDHFATQTVWYRLLNCGFRIPAAAGTDAMANYASLHGPVGMARVFAKSVTLDHAKWLAAIKAGRSFATNGPLVEFNLGGKEIGDSLLLKKPGSVQARVALRSIVGVDDHTEAAATLPLTITESGFYLVRAFADRARHPVLDSFPFATTSPIYVEVAGAPARSKADAEYFVAWVDRMQAGARTHAGYNSEAEKNAVLQSLAEARRVVEARSR
jgi:hypothetical protein